jgi:hypothetical protein
MASSITFQVKTTDGTVKFFSGDCFATVIEVIDADLLEGGRLILNGQFVNVYMTLHHENIADGSVLYLFKKAPKRPRQRRARRDMHEWLEALDREEEEREADQEQEKARIADVIWSGWEISTRHDRMCATMRERQLARTAQLQKPAPAPEPPHLGRAAEISIEPLPTWFGADAAE